MLSYHCAKIVKQACRRGKMNYDIIINDCVREGNKSGEKKQVMPRMSK